MSDKDKWKTYPCRECLLKGKCSRRCFGWPDHNIVDTYLAKNHLINTCLSCGYICNISSKTRITAGVCDECYSIKMLGWG